MDWSEVVKLLAKVAFEEGGRAIFWVLVFGAIGGLIGLIITVLGWSVIKLWTKDVTNIWITRVRTLFGVALGFFVILLLAGNGGFYGLIWSAEKTIKNGEYVENVFVATVSQGLDEEGFINLLKENKGKLNEITGNTVQEGQEDQIPLGLLRAYIEMAEDEVLTLIREQFLSDNAGEQMPEWVKRALEKGIEKVVVGGVTERIGKVLDEMEKKTGDSYISMDEVVWLVGNVFVKPEVVKFVEGFRVSILVSAIVQLAGILFIFAIIGILILFVASKVKRVDQPV